MRAELLVGTVFIVVYVPLSWHARQWLRTKERQGTGRGDEGEALLIALCVVANGVSYPTDAVESWSTNLRQVVRMASTVMAFEPAST
ncbi:hypothetical protein [Lentzea nigeriaca]|uniref:hypothetical protein n=1 Tax=Lentzea nigeriaca TaxID=1128665 RepID=UPI00195C0B8F|nr:hypothetical protein [Lentzea nigeriaca]MBM7857361.1 hypothetical protein [Lentzea nigeriaca]